MTQRYYSAVAVDTTVTGTITAGSTTVTLSSVTGYPIAQYPFTLALDYNNAIEELVDVTNITGLTATITRGVDGTTATGHSIGATVRHVITARDIREANTHVNTSSAVHGVAGALVGTTDTQTLTNKDLTAVTNVFPTSLVTLTSAQTITGKTMAYGSNTFTGFPSGYNAPTIGSTVINSGATVTAVAGLTLTAPTINDGYLASPRELMTISASAATGTIPFYAYTQGILYYTVSASANFTLNFTGNAGTTLNTIMNIGDAYSVVFMNTNGATPYYASAFQVDGSAVTPKWVSATAPSAGNASSIDVYSFTIIKTAAATFTVLAGGPTKFA